MTAEKPVSAQRYGRWLDKNMPWWLNGALLPVHVIVMLVLAGINAARNEETSE